MERRPHSQGTSAYHQDYDEDEYEGEVTGFVVEWEVEVEWEREVEDKWEVDDEWEEGEVGGDGEKGVEERGVAEGEGLRKIDIH